MKVDNNTLLPELMYYTIASHIRYNWGDDLR